MENTVENQMRCRAALNCLKKLKGVQEDAVIGHVERVTGSVMLAHEREELVRHLVGHGWAERFRNPYLEGLMLAITPRGEVALAGI